MGSFLQKLLTNPEAFKFYTENQEYGVSPNNQNPRTIPFGRDRFNDKLNEGSNQPYIYENNKQKLVDISGKNSSFYNDFTIRGGILAPLKAAEDVLRLTRFFADIKNPKGLLFLAKENILSRIGTKTEASKGAGYAGGGLNEGAYTPLSTIGQALIGFAGGHLNKQGLDPTGLFPGANINKYQEVISENQLILPDDFINNRLINLIPKPLNTNPFQSTGILVSLLKGYSVNPPYDPSTLIEYGGGPNSILGFGKTKIKFATTNDSFSKLTVFDNKNNINSFETYIGSKSHPTNLNRLSLLTNSTSSSDILLEYKGGPGSNGKIDGTTKIKYAINNEGFKLTVFDKNNSSNSDNFSNTSKGSLYKTWDYDLIKSQDENYNAEIKEDFKKAIITPNKSSTFLVSSPSYIEKNIEKRFNLNNPGEIKKDRSSYTNGTGQALDRVNASYIYKSDVTPGRNNPLYETDGEFLDIIPFIISILNNDNQEKNNPGTYRKNMHFRAFIDSFSDSYDADWSPIEYMGRAEKLYKYKGFGRKISMAFTVVAQSREEITAMYDKLNFLASSLAPEYLDSLSSGYMAGNIAYITLGEYIHDQPGIINSLTFDIPEESPWEIGINDEGIIEDTEKRRKDIRQLPHMIKVTGFNFTPIHKFRPEKQTFENDILGTDSTRLLGQGPQKYIDTTRPLFTNYDVQVLQEGFLKGTVSGSVLEKHNIPFPKQQNDTLVG